MKIPMIRSLAAPSDVVAAFFGQADPVPAFAGALSARYGGRRIYLTSSGSAAFYVILKALAARSPAREVVLPAYTAGSLVVAIRKAGMIPVLCDISLDDFNLDAGSLGSIVNGKTLAVVGPHMFGIPASAAMRAAGALPPGVSLIEDCAQAMGGSLDGADVGTLADASFFSFNRGKNFPLYSGGFIAARSGAIGNDIESAASAVLGAAQRAHGTMAKTFAFSCVGQPFVYGLGYPIIARFKDTAPPSDIVSEAMPESLAALGLRLMPKIDAAFDRRRVNAASLLRGLHGAQGIRLPVIAPGARPVYNSMPIVVEDRDRRDRLRRELWSAGVESSTVYDRPLHHIFDLGYAPEEFPNAVYFAPRLLALPVHQGIDAGSIDTILKVMTR